MRTVGLWVVAIGAVVFLVCYLTNVPVTAGLSIFALGLLLVAVGQRKPRKGRQER